MGPGLVGANKSLILRDVKLFVLCILKSSLGFKLKA